MSTIHTLQNPETRERFKYFKTITSRWADNDIYAHINNAVYYNYVDTLANTYLIEKNVLDIRQGDVIGFVVESGCQYRRPLTFPQDIQAGLRVAYIGTTSARYEVGLFAENEPEAVAAAYFVHVFVNRISKKPVPIPADVRQSLAGIRIDKRNVNI